MKKSEIYKLAQLSVLKDCALIDSVKLEVIRELQDKEGTALYVENREEEERKIQELRGAACNVTASEIAEVSAVESEEKENADKSE